MEKYFNAANYSDVYLENIVKLDGKKKVILNGYALLNCRFGKIDLIIDGNKKEVFANQIIFIGKRQNLEIGYGDYNGILVSFGGNFIEEVFKYTLFSHDEVLIDETLKYSIILQNIYDSFVSQGYFDLTSLGLFYQLLGQLIEQTKEFWPLEKPKGHYAETAKEYIDLNYYKDLSINEVANYCNVSANYLSNTFTRLYHCSPKEYLTKVRMTHAVELLEVNKYKVSEIALRVGYKNPLHFSSEFKKIMGYSPKKYLEEKVKN